MLFAEYVRPRQGWKAEYCRVRAGRPRPSMAGLEIQQEQQDCEGKESGCFSLETERNFLKNHRDPHLWISIIVLLSKVIPHTENCKIGSLVLANYFRGYQHSWVETRPRPGVRRPGLGPQGAREPLSDVTLNKSYNFCYPVLLSNWSNSAYYTR